MAIMHVEISIEGLDDDFLTQCFRKFEIVEEVGMVLPTITLDLAMKNFSLLPILSSGTKVLKLSYGVTEESALTSYWDIVDFMYKKDTNQNSNAIGLQLVAILHIEEFMSVTRQNCFEGKSNDVLRQQSTNFESFDCNYTGDDSMKWIQWGVSDWVYFNHVIAHAYANEDDLILGAITQGKVLVVKSVVGSFAKVLNGDTCLTFSPFADNDLDIKVSDYTLKSNCDGLGTIYDGALYRVLNAPYRVYNYGINGAMSIIDKDQVVSDKASSFPMPVKAECGNVHNYYYKADYQNIVNSVRFGKQELSLSSRILFADTNKLRLLDVVNFESGVHATNNSSKDYVDGLYLVTKIKTKMDLQGISQDITLNRDFVNTNITTS